MRHAQRHGEITDPCPNCKAGECNKCVDTVRVKYAAKPICPHSSADHEREVIPLWVAK